MSEHEVKTEDTQVRGYPGTVATCRCGWRSAWAVRDGSAESDANQHMVEKDPEYRERYRKRGDEWAAKMRADGCVCELLTFSYLVSPECSVHRREPRPAAAPHSHGCSCHVSAPCGACVNCAHADHPECPNDCQTCEDHQEPSDE